MDPPNILLLFSIENDKLVSKKELFFEYFFKWISLDELKNCFSIHFTKLKYFDDENELISLLNEDDFLIFKELLLEKKFRGDSVVVIAYDGTLNMKKFGQLDKVLKLKIEDGPLNSSIIIKSTNPSSQTVSLTQSIDDETTSSTSSSSLIIRKHKHRTEKSIKSKPIIRYAAKLKKELNYLPGSEVSDGQKIIKKWRIKNIGTKKWKKNSVKSVLLPSQYSNWITYSPIEVPICFADQKVNIEMEIIINGQWDSFDSSIDECSRDISLSWLLFNDSILSKSSENFKDYILAQLELCIIVKKRALDTVFGTRSENCELKKHLSESSIERIDHDFSLVDMSDEDQESHNQDGTGNECGSSVDQNITHNDSEDLEIELPDCPHGDDFQISDFVSPDHNTSFVESMVDQLVNVVVNNTRDVSKEEVENNRLSERSAVCEEVSLRHEEEVLIAINDESSSAEGIVVTRSDEEPCHLMNSEEIAISIDDRSGNDGQETVLNVTEITVEKDHSNSYEKIEFDDVHSTEATNIADSKTSNQNEATNDNCEPIIGEVINNQCDQSVTGVTNVCRDIPIDSIRNEFPRTTNANMVVSPASGYVPGCPYPVVNTSMNYVAGVGRVDYYNPPSGGPPQYYQQQSGPYNAPTGNIYPPITNPQAWNNSGNDVIENLRRSGNIHHHINETSGVIRAENGQHYVTTLNMEKLKNMGFMDEQKNYRLLMKFNNNIHDVVNDLID